MNIYVNGRFLTQPVTGVQRYAIELVKQWDVLLEAEREAAGGEARHEVKLLVPPGAASDLRLSRIEVRLTGADGWATGHLWEQLVLPWHARDGWLVNLCNTGPLLKRRQAATIHDSAVFAYPASFSFAFRNAYKVIQRGLGVMAGVIVTASEFSKSELVKHCRIPAGKIKVVPLGSEHMQAVMPDASIYGRLGVEPGRYVLAVSSHNPSKNFANLARAFERLRDADYEIVIAGASNARVFGRSELPRSDRVKLAGYVSDEQLKALYEGASCFVYPSLYEGFGLPPLEAMACGTPVIVSTAASLPEVCQDAALYCDPYRPEDIARQIDRMMREPGIRERFGATGKRQAARYSWERCARATLDAVKEAVQS